MLHDTKAIFSGDAIRLKDLCRKIDFGMDPALGFWSGVGRSMPKFTVQLTAFRISNIGLDNIGPQ